MFHTFQGAEPVTTLPIHLLAQTYDFYTFDKLLKFKLQGKHIQRVIKYRVEGMKQNGIRVPQDCETLADAVKLAHDSHEHPQKYVDQDNNHRHLNKIVVGKGAHQIARLKIPSAMNIVGDPGVPKSEIVVVGGILFKKGIQGNCHLQHLSLRQAKECGVGGASSFTMDDVLVEQCGYYGVWASGTGVVGRCTNMEVRECGWSGVVASNGGSITLIGAKTKVHHNCTKGDSDFMGLKVFGLKVFGASSTIQLVSPLTKEQVALDNGGGGNWGADTSYGGDINQIKTIFE